MLTSVDLFNNLSAIQQKCSVRRLQVVLSNCNSKLRSPIYINIDINKIATRAVYINKRKCKLTNNLEKFSFKLNSKDRTE